MPLSLVPDDTPLVTRHLESMGADATLFAHDVRAMARRLDNKWHTKTLQQAARMLDQAAAMMGEVANDLSPED